MKLAVADLVAMVRASGVLKGEVALGERSEGDGLASSIRLAGADHVVGDLRWAALRGGVRDEGARARYLSLRPGITSNAY